MKKLFLLLLFIPLVSFGQNYTTYDGILLSELKTQYIIVSKAKVYNRDLWVSLDYGQELNGEINGTAIKLDGELAKFPSVLSIINKLDNYEVVDMVFDDNATRYLLKYKLL